MQGSLSLAQAQAQQRFAALGLPTRRDETWKYTDIAQWLTPALLQAQEVDAEALSPSKVSDGMDLDAYRLVFVDGILDSAQSDVLSDSVHRLQDAGDIAWSEDSGALANGLNALCLAQAQDGYVLNVAANTVLDKPLYVLHVSRQAKANHVRHRVILGMGAEATVIEHFIGADDVTGFSNVVTDVDLNAAARLVHYRVQQESLQQVHVGRLHVDMARDSYLESYVMMLGASCSRADVHVEMHEAGAECVLRGLYVLAGRQHADCHTLVDHHAPHCRSDENYRGVLDGRSRGVFNGKMVVHQGAVKTQSAQSNATLLLSAKAEIDAKPELEIYNDDVRCAHGSTVGQLDDKQLFYLQSRGVAEDEAKELLTLAFVADVMSKMQIATVRDVVQQACFRKLPHDSDDVSLEVL